MLAKTYLSPRQLGITKKQFEALQHVMFMLEEAELVWTDEPESFTGFNGFSMLDWDWDEYECGTVRCIGAWADHLFGTRLVHYARWCEDEDDPLVRLFLPHESFRETITTEQAANAIFNFLSTGVADWNRVITWEQRSAWVVAAIEQRHSSAVMMRLMDAAGSREDLLRQLMLED